MGALTTENELLWPSFRGPSELAEVERIPLSERGLPASTYELVRRAAEPLARPPGRVGAARRRVLPHAVRADIRRARARRPPGGRRPGRVGREAWRGRRGRVGQLRRDGAAAARRGGSRDLRPDQSRPDGRARHRARAPLRREGHRRVGTRARPRRVGTGARDRGEHRRPRAAGAAARRQRRTSRPRSSRSTAPTSRTSQSGCRKLTTRPFRYPHRPRPTSRATCTPAARPAPRSWPRERTPTRYRTRG